MHVIAVERNAFLERGNRLPKVAPESEVHAQRLIGQSVGRVEFVGFEGNAVTLFDFFLSDLWPQHVDKYSSLVQQAGCQLRHGIDAVGVQRRNLAKELFLLLQVFQTPGLGSQGYSAEQQIARLW